jgi:hypothetical protein
MLLQTSVRLPSQPLESAEPVQLRRDSADSKQDFERVFGGARRASGGDQAAVVQFGARALDLARSEEAPDSASDAAAGVTATFASAAASGASGALAARGAAGAVRPAADGDDAAAPDVFASDEGEDDSSSVKGTVFAAAELTEAQMKQVTELQQRDREVHTHEQAHKAAGGAFTGSINLSYQMGPDGKRYAVEGSVPIDVSPVAGDPAATLRKMEVVHRAAAAPTSPSSADRQVAAQAQRVTQQARAQIAAERYSQARDLLAQA